MAKKEKVQKDKQRSTNIYIWPTNVTLHKYTKSVYLCKVIFVGRIKVWPVKLRTKPGVLKGWHLLSH